MGAKARRGTANHPAPPAAGPVALLRRAADAGDPEVLYLLARMHASGILVAKDPTQADRFLRRAARAGHGRAQVRLAQKLRAAPNADLCEAMRWLQAAALGGDLDAQGLLAGELAQGDATKADPGGAYLWSALAAMRGNAAAAGLFAALERTLTRTEKTAALRRLAHHRTGRPPPTADREPHAPDGARVTALAAVPPAAPAPVAPPPAVAIAAKPERIAALREAAEQGDAGAAFALGKAFAQGKLVPHAPDQAVPWLRRAAESGHVEAQFRLGQVLSTATEDPARQGEALKWWTIAGLAGRAEAKAERDRLSGQIDSPTIITAVRAATRFHAARNQRG